MSKYVPARYLDYVPSLWPLNHYQQTLAALGIEESALQQPGARVPVGLFIAYLHALESQYHGVEPPSLLTLAHFNSATHGLFGMATLAAPTVNDALATAMRYLHLVMPALRLDHVECDGMVLELCAADGFTNLPPILVEVAAGVVKQFSDYAIGDKKIISASFQHNQQYSATAYRDFFGCPVTFEGASNRFEMEGLDLNAAMQMGDSRTAHLLEKELISQANAGANVNTVEGSVMEYLEQNKQRLGSVEKAEVATQLGMTTRTLTRRLLKENAGFRALLNGKKIELAYARLDGEADSLGQIAEELGFSDAKAFSRFFKREVGKTPSQYRRRKVK
jgi:AraC-like DNA-binding protein